MKCQSLLSGENKNKYFRMLSAEIFTQHAGPSCSKLTISLVYVSLKL